MRIAIVSAFYSEGMGYGENCLPKALAALGHEVHVISSTFNVYGTSPDYNNTYAAFLGPAEQGVKEFHVDGYIVHRLKSQSIFGYVYINGVAKKLRGLRPAIVHMTEIASLNMFTMAAIRPFSRFKLFAETHQHMSVVKPYMRSSKNHVMKSAIYRMTRTVPTFIASLVVEKCYAISSDCAEVAARLYGVPSKKIEVRSLGTDTELFRPASTDADLQRRAEMRKMFGYTEDDIVCLYTGRLGEDKNPLVLAEAVGRLAVSHSSFHGLFFGAGGQEGEIAACRNVFVRPFTKHVDLADIYRMADIAVWPRQESMSMLDAAASGLPLIISRRAGVQDRVKGNGKTFEEDDVADLMAVLLSLESKAERLALGSAGRRKMVEGFSWTAIAKRTQQDYLETLALAKG